MKLLIENTDNRETMLISAVPNLNDNKLNILGLPDIPNDKPSRAVLRPGEAKSFKLEEGYLLGIEKL